ncbi:expressed unknown protein [Seminavis robusta]|uniref:Uncharacterized protein n=1 Tax=Seminavis robusta TaxID=568900 RepID=A0A9N8HHX4_9STRA|nr:expressed unknown protein [Seminavis robusta]|eukprot:Sro664_g183710.1 n/a (86) ;mRNA; f:41911-42168
MSHLLVVERFVVQDTWNEADDVELRDYLESLGGTTTVEYWSEGRILQGDIVESPNTIVQKLLLVASSDVVSSYPPELSRFLSKSP